MHPIFNKRESLKADIVQRIMSTFLVSRIFAKKKRFQVEIYDISILMVALEYIMVRILVWLDYRKDILNYNIIDI